MKKCLYCDEMIEDDKNVCSKNFCREAYPKFHNSPNTQCSYCGKKFYMKPYRIKNTKNICCSRECSSKLKKTTTLGKNNHQYGLKGSLNASWQSDSYITNHGYMKIRTPEHLFKDANDFVFEHRLIAEKYLLNTENSTTINGKGYLKMEYVVHHKDFNRLNNNVKNLKVMLKGEHQKYHNSLRDINRDKTSGRFISL